MPGFYLFSALVVATCGLVYELLAGTLASYLLGDSVTQFSTVIGAYLSAMGIGSWLSRFVRERLVEAFVRIEIIVGVIGGSSAALLFLAFPQVAGFRVALYGMVGLVGILVGLEIPLLLRILQREYEMRDLVSRVFAADYVGALLASLLFPLWLVPRLGLVRTGFLFGIINVAVAIALLIREPRLAGARWNRLAAALAVVLLACGFAASDRILEISEEGVYPGQAIYSRSTAYQRLVVTRQADDIRLFLNGNLQFSSRDEYRYHEALVHPILSAVADPGNVLVLGGGDGLAVREILRYPAVRAITLVDLDPAMTSLFSESPLLRALNGDSLRSPKLHIVTADAFVWLMQAHGQYDAIIVDFPDPSNYSIGKLYSLTFYRRLAQLLGPGGYLVIQSTSPYVARQAYWCVLHTVEAAGLAATAYHAFVPSFGEWGYIAAGHKPYVLPAQLPGGLRFLDADSLAQMFSFAPDMQPVATEVNRLDNQALVRYFESEWGHYLAE